MKNLLVILTFISILCFSCNKKREYTISGFLYTNCSKSTVVKNGSIDISETNSGMGSSRIIKSGTTDGNGYFSITYSTTEPGIEIYLTSSSATSYGFTELGSVKYGNQSNLELFIKPETQVKLKVITNRVLTQNDTLYILNLNLRTIIKPENNQIVQIITGLAQESSGFTWGLGYQQYLSARSGNLPSNGMNFTFPLCGQPEEFKIINIQ